MLIVTIPNYFLEKEMHSILTIEEGVFLEYSKMNTQKVFVRNTMHGMLIVQEGSKNVELEDKTFILSASTAMLFSQGNYFSSQNSDEYRGFILFFDDQFIHNFVKKYTFVPNETDTDMFISSYGDSSTIKHLVSDIVTDIKNFDMYTKALLKLRIETLMLELLQQNFLEMRGYLQHISNTSSMRLRYILEENIETIESVEDMYRLTRMSPTAFGKKFRILFKKSPKVWLDEQRMKKAVLFLQNTQKSISEIAVDCGYATASWFIVQFKKYYNMTPKEYRDKNQH